ncbi:unnamed protein product, partial [Onchocerca flexuosa]|uniref:Jumonji domain-containing protein 4 n=1 Tax=Onchocerca flexuosa TaxID=387005 RepID=A0A183I721_9BILA
MATVEEQLLSTVLFPMISLEETKALDVFIDFMLKNQPCRISTKATARWKSRQQWVKHMNGKSSINIEFLIKQYGHMEVPLIKEKTDHAMEHRGKCMDDEGKSSCSQECQKIKLKDYIEMMLKDDESNNIGYAKDWHFQQESGTSYEMYELPSVLRFDWVNNELWTPFHADVMSSYSWSANICGRKLWYFVTPGNEECFRIDRDTFLEDIRTMQDKWPRNSVISFIQEEGEIVFVPS